MADLAIISFISLEKSPFSWCRRNSKPQKGPNKARHKTNKKWKTHPSTTHTCSGTINSSMYDSDLTITTSPVTSSAPTVGKGRWQAPSDKLSFWCHSGSNRKTQPYYWLATDPTKKTRQWNKERQGKRTGKD
jgi:hypothetical protein